MHTEKNLPQSEVWVSFVPLFKIKSKKTDLSLCFHSKIVFLNIETLNL